MQAFIDVLDIKEGIIAGEVQGQKNIKYSSTLNAILLANFQLKPSKSSKVLLQSAWSQVVDSENADSDLWKDAFVALDRIISELFANEDSREVVFSAFRKIIKDKFGGDSMLSKLSVDLTGLTKGRMLERQEQYMTALNVKNLNRHMAPAIYVEDIIDAIKDLKHSNNIYEKFIAVMLATGSRSIEVSSLSTYTQGRFPHEICIEGLAKSRGKDINLTRNLVGMTAEDVIALVAEIRSTLILEGANAQIANTIAHPLRKAFDNTIGKLSEENMTVHSCRSIAGNINYLIYGKPCDAPYETYLQVQYGHASPASTKAYLSLNIKFRDEKAFMDAFHTKDTEKCLLLARIDELEREMKVLRGEVSNSKELLKKEKKDKLPVCVDIDIDDLKNTFDKTQTEESKVLNVVEALNRLKEKKIRMTQVDLRKRLSYSGKIMTEGYKRFRLQAE